jgi:hypothetical protein
MLDLQRLKHRIVIVAIFSLALTGCQNKINQFSSTSQQFQDSVKGEFTLCFYPSTIRMLNFDNDETIKELTGTIKKLKIITYKPSDITIPINISALTQKIKNEKYGDLLRFKQKDKDIQIYMLQEHGEPKKFYGIINDSSQLILIDLVGNIPLKHLTSIATGKINLSGFQSVLNFTRPSIKHKNKKK